MINKYFVIVLLLSTALFESCKEKDVAQPLPGTGSINFSFKEYFSGSASPGSFKLDYINSNGNYYDVTLLEYMITKIVLHRADGSVYDDNTVNYINASDENSKNFSLDSIPSGEYVAISFILGVDSTRNVSGGLPNKIIFNNMEWPETMGGGYHFLRLEGNYIKTNQDTGGYALHFGNTNQNTDFPHVHRANNQVKYKFEKALNINANTLNMEVVFDVNQLMDTPHLMDLNKVPDDVMMSDSMQHILSDNAVDVFSISIN